jgi:hypothetical protein
VYKYETMWGNDSKREDGIAKQREDGPKRPNKISSGEQVVVLVSMGGEGWGKGGGNG